MHSRQRTGLCSFLLAAGAVLVVGQNVIPSPNYNQGWCYFCSDGDAPPLCNADCVPAIDQVCNSGQLNLSMTATSKSCQVEYMPPPDGGQYKTADSPQACTNYFNQILSSCGKDASTPETATPSFNQSYCTSSGGGGTYGWADDGSVLESVQDYTFGRYKITTPNTGTCGQSTAPWKLPGTQVIQWNTSWVQEGDQVILDTNPPPPSSSEMAALNALPPRNPMCDYTECDIMDNPYYAKSVVDPWPEPPNSQSTLRFRVVFQGWSDDTRATRLFNSLHARCGQWPGNFQPYLNSTDTQIHIADFNLNIQPTNPCGCISEAIFDASVGIVVGRSAFCGLTVPGGPQGTNEFITAPPHDDLRRREHEPDGLKGLFDF
ncbi:MAG: hypothetical protein Q9191_001512 [Dirinaria sp. TL-2023a]